LIINTIDVSKLLLLVEENNPTILYFDENYLEKINLSYQKDNYIALSFSFNDISKFNINISDILNNTISNSTTIFLDPESLFNIKGNKININIEQFGNKYLCLSVLYL